MAQMPAPISLEIIPCATHFVAERCCVEQVARLARR
jgi:hypothetical protein